MEGAFGARRVGGQVVFGGFKSCPVGDSPFCEELSCYNSVVLKIKDVVGFLWNSLKTIQQRSRLLRHAQLGKPDPEKKDG